MGLSNSERIAGIASCIDELTNIPQFKLFPYDKFNPLLEALWPALLSRNSNSAHWIMGGALDEPFLSEFSLITAAFSNHISRGNRELDKSSKDDEYSNYEYVSQFGPTAISLLHNINYAGSDKSNVYKIFKLT